jgi:hypothetical protein
MRAVRDQLVALLTLACAGHPASRAQSLEVLGRIKRGTPASDVLR